jgi:hypothetical protein
MAFNQHQLCHLLRTLSTELYQPNKTNILTIPTKIKRGKCKGETSTDWFMADSDQKSHLFAPTFEPNICKRKMTPFWVP